MANTSDKSKTNSDRTQQPDSDKSVPGTCLYVIGAQLKEDEELIRVLKECDTQLLFFDDHSEIEHVLRDEEYCKKSCFVVPSFEGDVYLALRKATPKIFGPVAVKHYSFRNQPLPAIARPLYCNSMSKVVICFAGFRSKEDLVPLVDLVHYMGGSIRKEFSTSVTHLIANSTSGLKYRYAADLGKPIMSSDWILTSWKNRDRLDYLATDVDPAEFRLKPFMSCTLTFVGFSEEEKLHMEELTVLNGGKTCKADDPLVTHMVIDDQNMDELPPNCSSIFLVKVVWFWTSIQIEKRADEFIYQLKSVGENSMLRATPGSGMTPNSRARKRKRLKDTLGQLASLSDIDACSPVLGGTKQRRSGELAGLSVSPSLLDATVSPMGGTDDELEDSKVVSDVTHGMISPNASLLKTPHDLKSMSARQQVCHEILQTEINYVGILHTILTHIKDPTENPDQVGGPLLDPTEVKIIFGNVPPIYEIHRQLRDDLLQLVNSWKEENSIGELILKYSLDFLKAYPPFVNFFEKTKEMVVRCDTSKPRFHAFLKICQKKPECGRQSLVELLIRPVQRLPSVILLLSDTLKHTAKNNPDHKALEEAVKCLKEVLTHINEDKRKTESQVAMFGIVNDIENCPPNLLSSHRSFLTKADTVELNDGVSGKGDNLTLFLFTDVLEICKRRKSGTNNVGTVPQSCSSGLGPLVSRSPSVVSLHMVRNCQKSYKHVELLPLSHIKRVVDIVETDECHNVFALVCRATLDVKERLYVFTLVHRDVDIQGTNAGGNCPKIEFLRMLCRNVANTVCRPDVETFFTSLEPHHLDIMSSDTTANTLSKAVRFASRTSKKVSRAFSFSKTPQRLSRAVSTMISPLVGTVSPAMSPLKTASKRFPCASTANLHLIDSSSQSVSTTSNNGRKLKSFTIGPSSVVKRL